MKKKMTFEESLGRIDEIVKALERGDAPLEKSLSMFEEATGLIKECGKLLDEAEQRVVKLKKGENGEPEETPFEDCE